MDNKMKSALLGGVALGVLSAVPFINTLNACCCAWAILGGVLTSYRYIKSSPTPVKPGDGALLGLMAGGIGAVVYIVLGVPLIMVMGNTMGAMIANIVAKNSPEQAEQIRMQMAQSTSFVSALFGAIIGAVVLAIFATIGGLIGVAIFEKRKDGGAGPMPSPPPPPNFSGGQPGASGGYGSSYGANQ